MVDADVMQLIIKYLTEHNGRAPPDIQRPLRSPKFEKCVDSQWDVDYVKKIDLPTLFKIVHACEEKVMDIRPLYDLACSRIGSFVRGKTAQELQIFLEKQKKSKD
eukprot:UN04232